MKVWPLVLTLAAVGGCTADRPTAEAVVASPAEAPASLPEPRPGIPAAVVTTVPTRFQGRYANDAEACANAGHESSLSVGADTITFYESGGPIQSVAGDSDELKITARLTGEGKSRQATFRFGLSTDARTLTDLDGGMARQRCA